MTDIQSLVQTALDTALNGAIHVFWQRKVETTNLNPDEYIVYTRGQDTDRAFADDEPIVKEAEVTIRYYYKYELMDTAQGRFTIKNREEKIMIALKNAGFSCLGGFFDAGDVDQVGCFTSVAEYVYGRVV